METTKKTIEGLKQCWAKEKFLNLMADSFFKLSLQIISRFIHWLNDGIVFFSSFNSSSNVNLNNNINNTINNNNNNINNEISNVCFDF